MRTACTELAILAMKREKLKEEITLGRAKRRKLSQSNFRCLCASHERRGSLDLGCPETSLRMPQEPQLPAWTSKMPKGGQRGSSYSSSPSVPSVVRISCWGWRGCMPQYWDVYCRAVWGWFNIKVVLKTTRQARQWLLVK